MPTRAALMVQQSIDDCMSRGMPRTDAKTACAAWWAHEPTCSCSECRRVSACLRLCEEQRKDQGT